MLLSTRVLETSARDSGARLDAYREDETFTIDIDLPGAGPASIDIMVDGEALTVRAERRRAADGNPRTATVERLDIDHLEARYDDGVLTLRIPLLDRAA